MSDDETEIVGERLPEHGGPGWPYGVLAYDADRSWGGAVVCFTNYDAAIHSAAVLLIEEGRAAVAIYRGDTLIDESIARPAECPPPPERLTGPRFYIGLYTGERH